MGTFSREYLFKINIIERHVIGINFIPGSDAYKTYGSNITINLYLSKEEKEIYLSNIYNEPPINTEGILTAESAIPNQLSAELEFQLKHEGFNTNDIYEILHV